MKCILMNKNTEVLIAEYNTESKYFDSIIEFKNINYVPYILNCYHKKKDDYHFRLQLSKLER